MMSKEDYQGPWGELTPVGQEIARRAGIVALQQLREQQEALAEIDQSAGSSQEKRLATQEAPQRRQPARTRSAA